jgi:flavin reductase (DIM6/NTAB) family NADH-FMN oxidoreductase RutF/DNA-binding IclR family transcriptional regulator
MHIVMKRDELSLVDATDTRDLRVVAPDGTGAERLDRTLRSGDLGRYDVATGDAWLALEGLRAAAVAGGCGDAEFTAMIRFADSQGWVSDGAVRAHVEYTAPAESGFDNAGPDQRKAWWRKVLGEYPTGVAIISALDAEGHPQGLVVGTFSSVSMEPPIVSFMPMRSSRSYSAVADCTRFRVSVLGAGHEELCRSFAAAPPEKRFEVGNWVTDEHGIPHLTDAVVWFDCVRSRTIEAGDHDIVLGDVADLGFGDGKAGMPMLFLKGGYGTFTIPQLDFDAGHLGTHLRVADRMSDTIRALAEEIDATVTLCSLTQDRVLVLSAANVGGYGQSVETVGQTFPFAAPLGLVFAAWDNGVRASAWKKAGSALGFTDTDLLAQMVTRVRERGYAVSIGPTMADRFEQTVCNSGRDKSELQKLWIDIANDYADLGEKQDWSTHVSSIQVPIFDLDGTPDLALVVAGIPSGLTREALDLMADRCKAVAGQLTTMIGGSSPLPSAA